MAGMFGQDNCSKIIYNVGMFGIDHYCVWSSPDVLLIWLGSYATVEVGDPVDFIPDTIYSADGTVPLYIPGSNSTVSRGDVSFHDNIIRGAEHPVTPVAVIVVCYFIFIFIFICFNISLFFSLFKSPITMSNCADLVLDGSRSLGTGGRAMTYFWSVLPGPPHTDALKLFLANIPGPLVVMPSSYVKEALVEGEDYIFSLTVENHFGNRSAVAFFGVNTISFSLSLSLIYLY